MHQHQHTPAAQHTQLVDPPQVSLWHDVPLFTSRDPVRVNFVCEIPKFSRKKYEIATKEAGNPIKQDEKKV